MAGEQILASLPTQPALGRDHVAGERIELSRAGQIVSNQTFQPILVFGVVGAIYFALCWPLSLYSARLEGKFAAATR